MEPASVTSAWVADVPPTFNGLAAKVWAFAPPSSEPDPHDARHQVTIGSTWLALAPGAHPLWSWHVLLAVALRDTPGVPPAHRRYPEAEYELLVLALDPRHPAPDPREWPFPGSIRQLEPPDAVVQFHGTEDTGAAELLELCARAVADGTLVPDSDHAESWRRTVKATAEHLRLGGHSAPETA